MFKRSRIMDSNVIKIAHCVRFASVLSLSLTNGFVLLYLLLLMNRVSYKNDI